MSQLSSTRATLAAAVRTAASERTPWGGSLLQSRGTLGFASERVIKTSDAAEETATTATAAARDGLAQPPRALGVHARAATLAGSQPVGSRRVGLHVQRRVTGGVSPPSYPPLSLASFSSQNGCEFDKAKMLISGRLAASTNVQGLLSAVQDGHRGFNSVNSTSERDKRAELATQTSRSKRTGDGEDILNTVRLLIVDRGASVTPFARFASTWTKASGKTAVTTSARSKETGLSSADTVSTWTKETSPAAVTTSAWTKGTRLARTRTRTSTWTKKETSPAASITAAWTKEKPRTARETHTTITAIDDGVNGRTTIERMRALGERVLRVASEIKTQLLPTALSLEENLAIARLDVDEAAAALQMESKGPTLRIFRAPPKSQNYLSGVHESRVGVSPRTSARALAGLSRKSRQEIEGDADIVTLQLAMRAAGQTVTKMVPSDVQLTLMAFATLADAGNRVDAGALRAVISVAAHRDARKMKPRTLAHALRAFATLAGKEVDIDAAAVRATTKAVARATNTMDPPTVVMILSTVAELVELKMDVDAAAVQETVKMTLHVTNMMDIHYILAALKAFGKLAESGMDVDATAVLAVSKEASRMACEMKPEVLSTAVSAVSKLANMGYALEPMEVVLRAATASNPKVQQLNGKVRGSHLDLSPRDVALDLIKLAKLLRHAVQGITSHEDVATVQLAMKAAERTACKMAAHDVQTTLTSFALLLTKKVDIDKAALRAVVNEVSRVTHEMNPHEVSNTMLALARLAADGFDVDVAAIQAVSNAAQGSANEMNHQHVSTTLRAMAMLAENGVDVDATAVRAVSTRAVRVIDNMRPPNTITSVQAIAKLIEKGIHVDAAVVRAFGTLAESGVNLSPRDVALDLIKLAKLLRHDVQGITSHEDVATVQLAMKAAERTACKMAAHDVQIALASFAVLLTKKVDIDRAALRAVVNEVSRVAHGMNPHVVSNTILALAQLAANGFDVDAAAIQAVSNAAQGSANEMIHQHVSTTLRAMAMLAENGVDVDAAAVQAVSKALDDVVK